MIIPKGVAWQHLRAQCFDAIPAGTTAHYTRAVPLHEWRRRGSFTVATSTKTSIKIEVAGVEFGDALLADAEYLLDHGAEHHATVRSFLAEPGDWHSPAWAAVTIYYWAFFCAMAITRLAGRTVWFLDRAALTEFRNLAGSTTQPGAGAFEMAVGPYGSATNREVVLRPSKSQLHHALWTTFHRLIEDLFGRADQSGNPLEYRLIWCLHEVPQRLGPDWPSTIRNLVNYLPGRAYREVIRSTEIDTAQYVRRKSPFNIEKLISNFENEVVKIKAGTLHNNDLPLLCRLSALMAITVADVAEELHLELIDRTAADRRWLNVRRAFLKDHCLAVDGRAFWPLSV